MSRAIDLIITYRVVKMLVTPFNKFKAYDLGIIDADGKVLRKFKEVKGSERKHYTMLHRFVFNLKRILKKVERLDDLHYIPLYRDYDMKKVARSSSNESDFIYYVSNGFSGLRSS